MPPPNRDRVLNNNKYNKIFTQLIIINNIIICTNKQAITSNTNKIFI